MAKKVLLFGDIGIDDTVALMYAQLNEEIDIVGVVADYGNVSREDALTNIHYLFNVLNFPAGIPVIGGAEIPLTAEQPTYYPDIHGVHGLGPIVPDDREIVIENFLEIVHIIRQYKDELIIVNIGRMTSLATMFILYKKLMGNVKEFYLMGGAFGVPGNVTPVAEANFHADPIAVKIVLSYADNVTIIPLNATQKAIVTPEMIDYIDHFGKAKIFKPLMDFYTEFYQERDPTLLGSPVHDALTLIAVIHSEMLTFQYYPIEIGQQLEGLTRGLSIADTRPSAEITNGDKIHRIAFDLDYAQFFHHFLSVMTVGQADESRHS